VAIISYLLDFNGGTGQSAQLVTRRVRVRASNRVVNVYEDFEHVSNVHRAQLLGATDVLSYGHMFTYN